VRRERLCADREAVDARGAIIGEACGIGDCVTVPVLEPGLNVIRSNLWHQGDKKI